MTLNRLLTVVGGALVAVLLAGCPVPQIINPPPVTSSCTLNPQCLGATDGGPATQVCEGGQCVPGQCTQDIQDACNNGSIGAAEKPFCCRLGQQCTALRTCEAIADPDAPVGGECISDVECPEIGQFCSGGRCYLAAGKTPCTGSFQCGQGERCDLPHHVCVEDNGGCNFCGQLPELCCDEASDELCDEESHFCIATGDAECDPDAAVDACRDGLKCDDLGRCVQCETDDECGAGTACNVATGRCFSVSLHCESDEDCTSHVGYKCATATQECRLPVCTSDDQCNDERETCDTGTFTCILPPANCAQYQEADEPNDTPDNATAFVGPSYTAQLCRGNSDVISFAVTGSKRYRATVRFPDFNAQQGVVVAMLDGNRTVTSSVTISTEQQVTVSAITSATTTGTYYVRIVGGGTNADLWAYTLTLEETDAPQQADCSAETSSGFEPNGTIPTAYALDGTQPPAPQLFGRCGLGDVDYYKVDVPPLVGMRLDVEFDDGEGDLDIRLLDAANTTTAIDTSTSSGDIETVETTEGPTQLILEVKLRQGATSSLTNQSYTVRVTTVPRPAACAADVGEPDGTVAIAQTVALGAVGTTTNVAAIRCISADTDILKITLPAGLGGTAGISFDHNAGDLRLDLYDAAGAALTSYVSNASTATNGRESIELPQDAAVDRDYFVRVKLSAGTGTTGQAYTFSASTYDAGSCLRSEPVTDDDFAIGRCVGTFTSTTVCNGAVLAEPLVAPALATCAATAVDIAGCATTCGATDQDTYRVGTINNGQLVQATLKFDPLQGALGLGILRQNAQGQVGEVKSASDTDADGTVTISIIAPTVDPLFAREHAVIVKPIGSSGYAAQPYAISIDVGPECTPDDAEPNESPADSTLLRPGASEAAAYDETLSVPSLCGGDVDVYEILAFAGETVTATLTGPAGLVVEIGSRPADLSQPATMITSAPSAPTAATTASVNNATNRQLYFTVKQTDLAVAGAYMLVLQAD